MSNKKHPLRRILRLPKFRVDQEKASLATALTSTIVSLVSNIISVGVTATSTNWLLHSLTAFWHQVPLFFASTLSRVGCSFIVVILGLFFFWLRESKRYMYALLEMGVAAGTAFNASSKLFHNQDTNTALITLLGSVYIAVRACDNYDKWLQEQEAEEIVAV